MAFRRRLPFYHEFELRKPRTRRWWCTFILLPILLLLSIGSLVAIIFTVRTYPASTCPPPTTPSNGLQQIVTTWHGPGTSNGGLTPWPQNFSHNITPIPCHSHNDYERRVPLYDALLVGCTSVEADVWLRSDDLLVGHEKKSLREDRTLKSLYLDPLMGILEHQNQNSASPSPDFNDTSTHHIPHGVFDDDPATSITLLIDFKSDGAELWPILWRQLQPLRERGWLTHWTNSTNSSSSDPNPTGDIEGGTLITRPVTIVATGNALFSDVVANSTYRDIFFDAPLLSLSDSDSNPDSDTQIQYTTANSFYASVDMKKAVGKINLMSGMSPNQDDAIQQQVEEAEKRGLKARYWNTPEWPTSLRNEIWEELLESGVGVLNMNDLIGGLSFFGWREGKCREEEEVEVRFIGRRR